ncbi:MAG: EAL domain-containing protein [Actinobacteria bacterium]|nr:EAL domain-containing protein [Actinomycetota bacterium]
MTPAPPPGIDALALLGALPDPVVLVEADGTIRWVSPASLPALGWEGHDLVGRSAFDLFAKEVNRDLHLEALAELLATPGLNPPLTVTVVGADGALREIELSVCNALDQPGIGLLVASCRDVTGRETVHEELRQREAWSASLVRATSDLIFVCGAVGTIASASPSVQRLLAVDPASLTGRSLASLVHPDDLMATAHDRQPVDRVLGTGPARRRLLRFGHADGSWVSVRLERSWAAPSSERSILFTGRLVTEEDAAADLVSHQTVLLERIARGAPVADTLRALERLAADRLPDGDLVIGYYDPSGDYPCEADDVDPDLVDILKRTGIVRPPAALPPVSVAGAFRFDEGWDSVLRAASGGRYHRAWVTDLVGVDGRVLGRVSLLCAGSDTLAVEDLDVLVLVADLATIAVERHGLQARLAHGALHDELTGLPNRRLLLARLRDQFSSPDSRGGLLFVDLDRFKLINDSLGHEAGDKLLQEVTLRFQRALRPDDLVARVGGDEFVVLCPDLDGSEAVVRVADRLTTALVEPIDLPGGRVVVSSSIGVVHVQGEREPTAVLQDADLAMYEAKQLGRNRTAVFHAGLRDRAIVRLEVENALRDAIRSDEMHLHYQPVIRLRDGRMTGVEALLRWQRPGVGLVQPGAFVPVATDTGLILPLGRWVIEQAAAAAARWPELEVAANLSARQLTDADLVEFVADVLDRNDVAPSRLCLEVTEADLIVDTELVVDQLARFKDLGVRLAIDDFGTGFATLDYLRRFASADVLKVDASFVAGVTDPSSHDLAIVSAAMVLADNLGFDTVAEGVETEAQREVLERLGCSQAQGYLFSRPVEADAIDVMVRSQRQQQRPARADGGRVSPPGPAR